MTTDPHEPPSPPLFYRLERTLVGERLVPVTRAEEATHAGIALIHHMTDAQAHAVATLRADLEQRTRRVRELEVQLGRAVHRVDQAEALAAQRQTETALHAAAVQRLVDKNATLIGEKRRLREQLVAKYPPPPIHYRLDVDRDDQARESVVLTLDAFPHRDRMREALAEARRLADRRGGQVRQLRLDTVAWRAVVQLLVGD